ncbi:hypothetical protein OUZ56_001227 [Daphnia magna]|uniref:Uncharacterized protein n=1 Tax=Daphnia magna TaxID=35525 RepID=A0ABR0A218_9CRUS|nr:hypothetical protein OUZ56_001227 [Daphnia magna]
MDGWKSSACFELEPKRHFGDSAARRVGPSSSYQESVKTLFTFFISQQLYALRLNVSSQQFFVRIALFS